MNTRDRVVVRARRRREWPYLLLGVGTPIVIVALLVVIGRVVG